MSELRIAPVGIGTVGIALVGIAPVGIVPVFNKKAQLTLRKGTGSYSDRRWHVDVGANKGKLAY